MCLNFYVCQWFFPQSYPNISSALVRNSWHYPCKCRKGLNVSTLWEFWATIHSLTWKQWDSETLLCCLLRSKIFTETLKFTTFHLRTLSLQFSLFWRCWSSSYTTPCFPRLSTARMRGGVLFLGLAVLWARETEPWEWQLQTQKASAYPPRWGERAGALLKWFLGRCAASYVIFFRPVKHIPSFNLCVRKLTLNELWLLVFVFPTQSQPPHCLAYYWKLL